MEQKLKYISLQRGHRVLTLLDGTEIKAGASFETEPSNIPGAFKDLVRVVSVAEPKKEPIQMTRRELKSTPPPAPKVETGEDEKLEEDIKEKENKPKATYIKKHVGGGKYNVLDEEGNVLNEKPLTGIRAVQMMDELMS